jgi:flagellar protein FlaG
MDVSSINAYDAPMYEPPPVQTPDAAVAETPSVSGIPTERERETQTEVKSMDGLERALEQINKSISGFRRHMQISVHQKTNRIMVKVMDTQKNEIIREIPPEKALDAFATALEMAGILLDRRS